MRRFSAISAISAGSALLIAGAALSVTPEQLRRPASRPKPPVQDANPPPAQQPAAQTPAPATAAPQPAPARLPADVEPDKLQPYNLPPASRQRMRKCGEEWRDLKMAGKSAGLTWRSFAQKCLPGQD